MRGGAINPTVLAGLSNNTPYVCGSTRIDQATALGKTEAYDIIYGVVRGAGAGGRQAAIATEVARAAAARVAIEDNYIIANPNYVGLYKSGGNFYTVPINKAPGTVASDPGNVAAGPGAGVAPAPRVAILAAAAGAPGQLLTAAGPGGAGAVQADYIIVQA